MLRRLIAFLVPAIALVAISSESYGDEPSISAGQRSARDAFNEDMEDDLESVKTECGTRPTLVTDFQNFDADAEVVDKGPKKKGGDSRKERALRSQNCSVTLQMLAKDCQRVKAGRAARGARLVPVKSVACLFAGHKDRKPKEASEEWVSRNVSYDAATAQLTVRQTNGGGWPMVDDVLPVVLRPDVAAGLFNGMKCAEDTRCRSHLCASSTCVSCANNGCHGDLVCYGAAVCNPPAPRSGNGDDSSSSPSSSGGSSSKPAKRGKGLGKSCNSTSECESGRTCKQRTPKIRTCQ